MADNITQNLMCPVCGNKLEHTDGISICPECGYSSDPVKAAVISESDKYRKDASIYRLMSAADTYFSRKNYDEAYISYNSVLDSDPHCLKAVFRRNITGQYLMYETSSVYLSGEPFFRKMRDMLTSALENNVDEKLTLTMCRDMLDLILFNSEYERKFAASHKNMQNISEYLSNLLELLEYTRFIMKCIVSVDKRESAFAVMKCFDTGAELHSRIFEGMECSGSSGTDSPQKIELSRDEKNKAEKLYDELFDIKQCILKNADDVLYGELKSLEKKDPNEQAAPEPAETFRQAEYEDWRKTNIKALVSADRKNILFGMLAKTAFAFAVILAVIFISEAIISDEIIGEMALSAVLLTAVGATSLSLERNFESKRKFYAKLVHSDSDRRGHE